jgi:hypothetical protein
MKKVFLLLGLFVQLRASGQKAQFFPGVSFDSSYTVVGICQGYGKQVDSLERFWFVLDNPEDMKQLQRDWQFKKRANLPRLDFVSFDVYVIQGKRLASRTGLIIPQWGIVADGLGGWYRFDTAWLAALHASHPLHYHSEHKRFQTYGEYAAYGNSELNDPKLLFFFEPDIRFEGKFEIISDRTSDPSSPIFVLRDINKELEALAPKGSWEAAGGVETDTFAIKHPDETKVVVRCSKALYEKYAVNGRQKGDWQPEPIEMILFWRDE